MNSSSDMTLSSSSIVFVINTLKVGGAAKMIKYVANLSTEWFGNVHLITLYDDTHDTQLDSNILQHSLNINRHSLFWRWKAICQIRDRIKKIKPTIVCTFVSDVCVLSRIATLGINTKVVSAERGDPFTLGKLWGFLVSWTYRLSDYCFFQLEQARDYFGSTVIQKSFVIPNVFEPQYNYVNTEIRNKTIVSAGRFVEEKRYDVLINAYSIVRTKYPEYKLIIYGDGPYREKYEQLVMSLGISDYVFFPGYVKNVSQSIVNDGIFVLSSRYEGIPNSLIEALSVGIPCVATDCTPGGPAFLTMNGKNGILIPVDDVEAMAKAIEQIIASPQLQEELSARGPLILSYLSPDRVSKMWKNAFLTIISK